MERRQEQRCGPFLLKRVQRGSEKPQTPAPNGFSLFVMRLLLPVHVALLEELDGKKDSEVSR